MDSVHSHCNAVHHVKNAIVHDKTVLRLADNSENEHGPFQTTTKNCCGGPGGLKWTVFILAV